MIPATESLKTSAKVVTRFAASVSFTLGDNVENLVLTGAGSIDGTGNALANILTGNGGNNLLDGGIGGDAMAGGDGDDTYVVDNVGDGITENDGEGTDTVRASVSFALGAQCREPGPDGIANLSGTGNALANSLTGNAGDNLLDGGAGADHMTGGGGNDTYLVDNVGDAITENDGEGTDTVGHR